jgi:hypothetical protein
MAVTQEQMDAVNFALRSSQEQVATLSRAIDSVREEASNAVSEIRGTLAVATAQLQERKKREMSFVNVKTFDGGTFAGARGDNTLASYRAWAKKVKVLTNAQSRGSKKILGKAEKSEGPVDVNTLTDTNWESALEADSKLHDFLCTYTTGDALMLVESCPDQGFEAWRALKVRHNPEGGTFELQRMENMFSSSQCKNIAELPSAVDRLERDIKHY